MALLQRPGFRGRLPLVWILLTCALVALVAVLALRLADERRLHASRILDLEGSRAALQREIAERQAAAGSLAGLRAEIARAEGRQRAAAQSAREAEAEAGALEARRKAAKEALAAAAVLRTDLAEARAKVEGAVREADALQRQLAELRSDRDRLAEAILSLHRKQGEAEAKVAETEARRIGGLEELSRLDALLERTRREVSEAQGRSRSDRPAEPAPGSGAAKDDGSAR